jgi:hypothetical protein
MKTLWRVLIILAAAAVIAGLAVSIVNISGVQAAPGTGQGQFHASAEFQQGGVPSGHGRSAAGSFSLNETIKNLTILAVIIAVVVASERLIRIFGKKKLIPHPVGRGQPGRKE